MEPSELSRTNTGKGGLSLLSGLQGGTQSSKNDGKDLNNAQRAMLKLQEEAKKLAASNTYGKLQVSSHIFRTQLPA